MPDGWNISAEVAGERSPPYPAVALEPAMVEIFPLPSTRRMRLLLVSAIRRRPEASKATSKGKARVAEVAGPPSPEKLPGLQGLPQMGPLPAMVVMLPPDTLR